jgi:hypothetical protein
MIEHLFDKGTARRRTRHAATRRLSNASIRRCSIRSPDRLSRRAVMAAISRGAMTSATLQSRKGLIVAIGRQCGSAEWIPHRGLGAAGGSPSGPRGIGTCRDRCVPQARAPSGVVVAATRQVWGAVARRSVPCFGRRLRACRMTVTVAKRVPALLEELEGVPGRSSRDRSGGLGVVSDDVAVAGCVVEPVRHLVVQLATGGAARVRSASGVGWSGCR